MKKIIALIMAIAIIASLGIATVFAERNPNGPIHFYTNGGYKYVLLLDVGNDDFSEGWGGLDGISDKDFDDNADVDIYIKGLASFTNPEIRGENVVFPEIVLGIYVVDTDEYIWPTTFRTYDATQMENDWTGTVTRGDAYRWAATCFEMNFNTNILPEGEHIIKIVCQFNDDIFEIGSRNFDATNGKTNYVELARQAGAYDEYCTVIYVKSSGEKYVDPTVEDPTEDDPTEDNPTEDDPTIDEPSEDDPTIDEPTEDDPTEDEPTEDEPTNDNPSSDNPETGCDSMILFLAVLACGALVVLKKNACIKVNL